MHPLAPIGALKNFFKIDKSIQQIARLRINSKIITRALPLAQFVKSADRKQILFIKILFGGGGGGGGYGVSEEGLSATRGAWGAAPSASAVKPPGRIPRAHWFFFSLPDENSIKQHRYSGCQTSWEKEMNQDGVDVMLQLCTDASPHCRCVVSWQSSVPTSGSEGQKRVSTEAKDRPAGRRTWTWHRRRYTIGQWAREKMLNIGSHRRDANQSHGDIVFHTR